jgi:hypothetical protein
MQARRTRAFVRRVVAALVVAVVASTATIAVAALAAAGSTGPAVPKISSKTWNWAHDITSPAQLRGAPARVYALVTTPTVEVVTIRREGPDAKDPYLGGHAKAPRGCSDVWLSTIRLNVFGAVLMQARTTIRNWCTDGKHIVSQPTVQRSVSGKWGWVPCGWDDDYAGWLHMTTRFGAGGDALFAYGNSCAGARPQSHHDLQVHGDGTFDWSY